MKKRSRFLLALLCAALLAVACAGISVFASGTEKQSIAAQDSFLRTADGFSGGQVRTTQSLTGEYSVLYSISVPGITNTWTGTQYIGLGDESYLQIALSVDSPITVTKVDASGSAVLTILDAATGTPMANTRSYELGGAWFNGPEYIFKYEITQARLNLYFGLASAIADGTDAPICRGYIALDADIFGACTDGIASFAPNAYAADPDFNLMLNYMTIDGERVDLSLDSMSSVDNPAIVANSDVTIFEPSQFENITPAEDMSTEFNAGDIFRNSWVSDLPVALADGEEFRASFEVYLATSANNFIPSGLQFGFMFGMSSKDDTETSSGVTSLLGKLPMAGLDLAVGNGTGTDIDETTVGNAGLIFSANDGPINRLYVSLLGTSDGTLTVTYRTDKAGDSDAEFTFTDIAFDGYMSFFVEANNVTFAGTSTSGTLAFQNITLDPMPVIVSATGVSLNKTELTLEAGAKETLTATVAPDNATDKSVTWESSNEDVATVVNGTVTAVAAGEATITVKTANGMTATCKVTVIVSATGVSLNKTELTLEAGAEETLTATVTPDNATDKSVTWESSNEDVATVVNGTVTAVAAGEATITVKTANGMTATCKVTVKEAAVDPDPEGPDNEPPVDSGNPPAPEEPTQDEGGCGSFLVGSGSAFGAVIAVAAAFLLKRKRK